MTTLPAYPVYRVMANARYLGVWFRVERGRLFITGDTSKLTDDLRDKIKAHKPAIIEAVAELPDSCTLPTVCLNIGCQARCRLHPEIHSINTIYSSHSTAAGNRSNKSNAFQGTTEPIPPADFAGYAAYTRDLTDDDDVYQLSPDDIAESEEVGEEMRSDATLRADVLAQLKKANDPRTHAQLSHAVAAYEQAREAAS